MLAEQFPPAGNDLTGLASCDNPVALTCNNPCKNSRTSGGEAHGRDDGDGGPDHADGALRGLVCGVLRGRRGFAMQENTQANARKVSRYDASERQNLMRRSSV